MPSAVRKAYTPRAAARAKPLPLRSPLARIKLALAQAQRGAPIIFQPGDVLAVSGFRGLIDGDYMVEYVNPGFSRAAAGGPGGITIRLKPVPTVKPKAVRATKPQAASKARRAPARARTGR